MGYDMDGFRQKKETSAVSVRRVRILAHGDPNRSPDVWVWATCAGRHACGTMRFQFRSFAGGAHWTGFDWEARCLSNAKRVRRVT